MRSGAPTTFLLIRHGHTDAIGHRLVGRLPGVHLTQAGRDQAVRLPGRVARTPLVRIYSSPLERACETAEPLARARRIPIEILETLNEVDFGDWTGLTFEALAADAGWAQFNARRGSASVPGGEQAPDVQARIVHTLGTLHQAHPGETVALVSHADVIRYAVLHCAGAPLDTIHDVTIEPGSITTLVMEHDAPRIVAVNEREAGAPGM